MAQFSHAPRPLPGRAATGAGPYRNRGPNAGLLLQVLGQLGQEVDVVLALDQSVEQKLEAFVGADRGEHPPHRPDHLEDRLLQEQLLATGAGALDVDSREDALLGELAVQDELAVAGALELLVDDIVHAGAGVDEARTDDRERAALFDVSRGAEEALGRIEGDRVEAAREGSTGWRQGQVVGAGEAGDRVEQDDHVAAGLDLALGDLEG